MSKISKEMEAAGVSTNPMTVATQEESTPDHERPLLLNEKSTAAGDLRDQIQVAINDGSFIGWTRDYSNDRTPAGLRYNVTYHRGLEGLSVDRVIQGGRSIIDRFSFWHSEKGGVVERTDVTIGRPKSKDGERQYHVAYAKGHISHYNTNLAVDKAKKHIQGKFV